MTDAKPETQILIMSINDDINTLTYMRDNCDKNEELYNKYNKKIIRLNKKLKELSVEGGD